MRAPLKLLLIINRLDPSGGAEIQLAALVRGLSDLGERLTVCCIDEATVDPASFDSERVTLVQLGVRSRYRRVAALPRLIRLARQADVVHCTMWDPSLWGRIAAIVARRPVIVADHATDRAVQVAASGAPRAKWIAAHNRALDRFTFATVACATSQREVLIAEGVAPEKIVYIPNGIDIGRMAASAGRLDRAELGLPESAPVVMQVGVFRPEKNQVEALETLHEVRAQVPNAQLVFVGGGVLREDVERRAAELGATDWTHFLGHRTDVAALLSLADLQILPSISDAMPMVALEAMAVGVPTLATDVGDVRAILGDGGVCVPPGDRAALRDECVRLLGDEQVRRRMGEQARRRAGEFDASFMARRYQALFEAACADEPPIPAVAAAIA